MKTDVAVVGAGILGLAHAYFAAKRGRSVVVFERTPKARGASVRNFGMIWPIGQRVGETHQMAMRSRQIWQEILDDCGLPYRPTGSLHVVYHQDERDVGQEFAERAPALGYTCTWLSPAEVLKKSNSVNPDGLLGGVFGVLRNLPSIRARYLRGCRRCSRKNMGCNSALAHWCDRLSYRVSKPDRKPGTRSTRSFAAATILKRFFQNCSQAAGSIDASCR